MTRQEAEQIRLKGYEYQIFLNDTQKAMTEFRKLDSFDYDDGVDGLLHPLLMVANDYDLGFNLPMNHAVAKELYLLAVKHSPKYARIDLGDLYLCDGNYAEAKKLYEEALAIGYSFANIRLGNLYEQGLGVDIDYDKALSYYRIADKNDSYIAKRHIANMYFNGYGVAQDYNKAFEIYEQDYNNELGRRQKGLHTMDYPFIRYAYMLKNGYGCKANPERAMAILKQLNHKHIQNYLKEIQNINN